MGTDAREWGGAQGVILITAAAGPRCRDVLSLDGKLAVIAGRGSTAVSA